MVGIALILATAGTVWPQAFWPGMLASLLLLLFVAAIRGEPRGTPPTIRRLPTQHERRRTRWFPGIGVGISTSGPFAWLGIWRRRR